MRISDWSSDVCSSDLTHGKGGGRSQGSGEKGRGGKGRGGQEGGGGKDRGGQEGGRGEKGQGRAGAVLGPGSGRRQRSHAGARFRASRRQGACVDDGHARTVDYAPRQDRKSGEEGKRVAGRVNL